MFIVLPIRLDCTHFQTSITDVKSCCVIWGQKNKKNHVESLYVCLGETINEDQKVKVFSVRHTALQVPLPRLQHEEGTVPGAAGGGV